MNRLLKIIAIVTLLYPLAVKSQCTGSSNCKVCTNCTRCKHCKGGGSCGACSSGGSYSETNKKTYQSGSTHSSEGTSNSGDYKSQETLNENATNTIKVKKENESMIFTVVEQSAEYPGGIMAMSAFIQNNLKYPEEAIKSRISGKCFLKFIVNEDGSISNVEVLKGVPGCPECDVEAKRVVKLMPAWKPAKMNGEAVKSYFNLPVAFKIMD